MTSDLSPTPSRSALVLAYATIYLVWGSTYLGIRVAVQSMPPFMMAGVRFVVAGLILYTVLCLRGEMSATRAQWRANAIAGLFLILGGNGLVCWAETMVPSGIAALVVAVGPVFTVLIDWIWPGGQKPGVLTFGGLLLGIAGVTWLMAPWETATDTSPPIIGILGVLGACISWSIGSIYGKHNGSKTPALTAAAMQMLVGGGAQLLVSALRGEWAEFSPASVSASSWQALTYLVLVGSLVGFTTFAWLMKHSSPALVSTYAYVNPIVAVALGSLVLHEPLSPRLAIASVAIVGSVILISIGRMRSSPAS